MSDTSKARALDSDKLAKVPDERVRMALRLQAAFGLRREEALKFTPSIADKGDHLHLKGSWCKGGRPRDIPIRTAEQRALLDGCRRLVGPNSLVGHEAGRDYRSARAL